jgi:hypothetical protein
LLVVTVVAALVLLALDLGALVMRLACVVAGRGVSCRGVGRGHFALGGRLSCGPERAALLAAASTALLRGAWGAAVGCGALSFLGPTLLVCVRVVACAVAARVFLRVIA